ncbi:MAG: ATP-binding protein [Psychroflexus sp.]
MFQLKGKMLWFFTLFAIGLLGVGFYFYTTLNSLGNKVETSLNPNKASDHLKKIMIDLNKLNNLYLVDSRDLSTPQTDSLINAIEKNIDSVKSDYGEKRILDNRNLDTIPVLLRNVRNEYQNLAQRKVQNQDAFLKNLEDLIQFELSKIEQTPADSVTIVKQISSEIYDKTLQKEDSLNNEEEDNRSFLQRLFGSSKPQEESVRTVRDTLVEQSIDTLHSPKKRDSLEIAIFPLVQEYQQKRIRLSNYLQQQEQNIFKKNIEVNNYVEKTLNEIIYEEYNNYENSIRNLRNDSISYLFELGAIIALLILISLITVFIIFKDINKSIYFQKKLEKSEAKAKREAIEKQKFLSTMSHELRTPLTSIIGYTDLMNQNDENVKSLKSATNYLYQMTNEILDMAKIKAGIIEIEHKPNNISEVFEDIRNSFEPLIKNKNLKANFEIPKQPIYVYADAHRLQHILYNLMHNALKYTDIGAIDLSVKTQEKNTTQNIEISIKDTGIGMTSEEMKSVFEDYKQAGTHNNKLKGTGLGLGIVQNLVQKMGGNLKLSSESTQGTTFKLNFTFEKAEFSEVKKEITSFDLPKNSLENHHIFILDDDELITKLYLKLLKPYAPKITVFTDAEQAFQHLKHKHDYDLYIIDFKMPYLSGFEIFEKLKSEGIHLENTLVVTANVMLNEQDKKQLEVFDNQVFKPLKKEKIIRKIAEILGLKLIQTKASELDEKLNSRWNLKALKIYAGNDDNELNELLKTLVEENDKELVKFEQALQSQNDPQLSEVIHKLSSRFGQVDVQPIFDLKTIETDLRNQ